MMLKWFRRKTQPELKTLNRITRTLASERKEGNPIKFRLYIYDVEKTVGRPEIDELIEFFKEHQIILIEGYPFSGKTVIAKQFGLEMEKRGHPVYYADMRDKVGFKGNPQELPYNIEREQNKVITDTYIIIDHANYYKEIINFNWASLNKHLKILLVSRPYETHSIPSYWIDLSHETLSEIIDLALKTVLGYSTPEWVQYIENLIGKNLAFLVLAIQELEFILKRYDINKKLPPQQILSKERFEKAVSNYFVWGTEYSHLKPLFKKVEENLENEYPPTLIEKAFRVALSIITIMSWKRHSRTKWEEIERIVMTEYPNILKLLGYQVSDWQFPAFRDEAETLLKVIWQVLMTLKKDYDIVLWKAFGYQYFSLPEPYWNEEIILKALIPEKNIDQLYQIIQKFRIPLIRDDSELETWLKEHLPRLKLPPF